jgi:Tfp pilus assembly protein PilW
MLMNRLSTTLRHHRDERGFTLIETLVAMISAVVVVGALYAILDISVQQTAKVADSVQATQIGRTTMTKLADDLHSACISSGFAPIKEAEENETTKENKLVFVNAYGGTAEITGANKHEIIWNPTTKVLTDYVYKSESGTWPNFTYSSTKTTTRLGEDISETSIVNTKGETIPTPIFQYYTYNKTSPSVNSEGALSTLALLTGEKSSGKIVFSTKKLETAAAVEISYKQAPVDKYAGEDRAVDLKSLVTLAFSVPNAETPIEAKPCE